MQYAKDQKIPIIIEDPEPEKKKVGRSKKVNRKVSMLAYSAFKRLIYSKAFKEDVEIIGITLHTPA